MIAQEDFVAARRPDWEVLDAALLSRRPLHRSPPTDISRAASLYRAVCADLMRARTAGFSPDLVIYLDGLAARAHNRLYAAPPYRLAAVAELVRRDFPRTLRRNARLLGFAAALFLLPGVLGFVGALASRGFAADVLSAQTLDAMERAYAKGFGSGRDEGADAFMAGFYVWNNVGIAFRCFATGILFGLGSVFFLVYNGLVIGTVAGAVARAGHGMNLLDFCCGHSSFELTAIVISGVAGLRMGWALVDTGGVTRLASLRARGAELATLVFGAALMLLVAAGIEGFWSASARPGLLKRVVAIGLAALVAAYFTLVGRRTGASHEEP